MAIQRRYATLGDLVFGDVDEYGTRVYLKNLKGWDSGTPSTGGVEQRAADDGGWLDEAYLAPRLVELDLVLVGSGFLTVSQSISRIASGLPVKVLEDLVVDNHGEVLQARVRQSGEVLATQKAAQGIVSLSLIAPDPRRYAADEIVASTGLPQTTGGLSLPIALPVTVGADVSAGVLLADNAGDVDTFPVFTITGPCPPGATITLLSTAASLTFAQEIPTGHQLVIDTATRTALMDGTAGRTVTGTWFSYAPGANEVAFAATGYDPAALLTSVHRSARR